MFNVNVLAVGGAGWVRAVSSGRARGFAAPVDLLRAQLRAAGRVAVRRRVSGAFAGYLVTDAPGPVVWRDRATRRVVIIGDDCATGRARLGGLRLGFEREGGALDAPVWLAGGAVRRYEGDGEVCASVSGVLRAGDMDARMMDAPFSYLRRGYVPGGESLSITGGGLIDAPDCAAGYALDAPDFLAAGSYCRHDADKYGGAFGGPVYSFRGWK